MEQLQQMTQEQRERELVRHAMGNVVMAVRDCMQEGIRRKMAFSTMLINIISVCHQIVSEAHKDERLYAFIKGFDEMVESGEFKQANEGVGNYVQSLDKLSDLIYDVIG
ncbi:MAG: hypothetical protein AB1454_04130 [Candidatus Auribacterota bacterium]